MRQNLGIYAFFTINNFCENSQSIPQFWHIESNIRLISILEDNTTMLFSENFTSNFASNIRLTLKSDSTVLMCNRQVLLICNEVLDICALIRHRKKNIKSYKRWENVVVR